jgi:hypothetical protein
MGQEIEQFEITSDGRTVWVCGSNGDCLGRFGFYGIDIHTSTEEQTAGKSQCLECTHGKVTPQDWARFKEAMIEHYGIEVGDEHRPKHLDPLV